jgi:hypothetical protein
MAAPEARKAFMLFAVSSEPGDPRLRDEILLLPGTPDPDQDVLRRIAALLPGRAPAPPTDSLAAAREAVWRADFDAARVLALQAPDGLERASILIHCAFELRSLAIENEAVDAYRALDAGARNTFLASRAHRSWLTGLSGDTTTTLPEAVPTGWIEWFDRVNRGAPWPRALEIARRGALEWDAGETLDGAGAAQALAGRIQATRAAAADLLVRNAAPSLVQFLQRDPSWPRRELLPVYLAILFLVAADGTGSDDRNVFHGVSAAVLSLGLNAGQYTELVDWATELARGSESVDAAAWQIDMLEVLASAPVPAPEARLRFLVDALGGVRRHAAWLGNTHLGILRLLCRDLGHPDLFEEVRSDAAEAGQPIREMTDPFAALSGKLVALYTLTESAANRVAEILYERCPTVRVELCHDHVCTPQLKALASTADVFVMVTASAKHAATQCVEDARPEERDLLRVSGKGSTSILISLENWLNKA